MLYKKSPTCSFRVVSKNTASANWIRKTVLWEKHRAEKRLRSVGHLIFRRCYCRRVEKNHKKKPDKRVWMLELDCAIKQGGFGETTIHLANGMLEFNIDYKSDNVIFESARLSVMVQSEVHLVVKTWPRSFSSSLMTDEWCHW